MSFSHCEQAESGDGVPGKKTVFLVPAVAGTRGPLFLSISLAYFEDF